MSGKTSALRQLRRRGLLQPFSPRKTPEARALFAGFEAILNGEGDDMSEESFRYVGTFDEARERAKKAAEA